MVARLAQHQAGASSGGQDVLLGSAEVGATLALVADPAVVKGVIRVPKDFNAPLPDQVLEDFEER